MKLGATKIKDSLHMFMILPAVMLFLVFFIIPIVQGILVSFTNWNGFGRMDFIGLKNFVDFFSDRRAMNAVRNTLYFGFAGAFLLNILGLAIALLLDEGLKGSGLVRTLIYLPNIISPLIMGYIWVLILSSENGALKSGLGAIGLGSLYSNWLANPKAAIHVILVVNLWQSVGGNMMIYIAGLQAIPDNVLEAADVDGANYIRKLLHVKLPLLGPSLRVNIVTNLIGCMSIFDVIMSLTGGGPGFFTESLSIFIYRQSVSGNAGYSSAVAVMLFLIVLLPVTVAFIATKKAETYD